MVNASPLSTLEDDSTLPVAISVACGFLISKPYIENRYYEDKTVFALLSNSVGGIQTGAFSTTFLFRLGLSWTMNRIAMTIIAVMQASNIRKETSRLVFPFLGLFASAE